jgi:hypothetical protein
MFSRKQTVVAISLALFLLLILAGSIVLRPLFGYPRPINYVRWLVGSRFYKAEVLARPNSANKELKHIEWDGWGWGGEDTTVYLVFDPTDSLSAASQEHRPGKFNGIPCEVPVVRRMEKNWYVVQFYTDEWWGRRGALNCRGSGD